MLPRGWYASPPPAGPHSGGPSRRCLPQMRLALDMQARHRYHRAMTEPNPIVHALDLAGYRLTRPRRAVAGLISGHDGHFTAAELEAIARERRLGISRATLF